MPDMTALRIGKLWSESAARRARTARRPPRASAIRSASAAFSLG